MLKKSLIIPIFWGYVMYEDYPGWVAGYPFAGVRKVWLINIDDTG